MKKLTIGLAVLLSGLAANSFAALPTGTSRYAVCVPQLCGGFTFGLYGIYWQPNTSEQDFVLRFHRDDDKDRNRDGDHGEVNPNYQWGFMANIGYVFPCSGNDVRLAYTYYQHTHSNHRGRDDNDDSIDNDGEVLLPTISSGWNPTHATDLVLANIESFNHPIDTDPRRARAHTEFRLDAVDLDFGQYVNVGCNLRFRFFGGARYARIEHRLNAHFEGHHHHETDDTAPGIPVVGTDLDGVAVDFDVDGDVRQHVHQRSQFTGVGPRLGINADYHVGGGFGVVGELSSSLLVGRQRHHNHHRFEEEFDLTATDVHTSTLFTLGNVYGDPTYWEHSANFNHRTRVVPNIDAKLGVDYTYQFCNCSHTKLTVEAGWYVSEYFDSTERSSTATLEHPEFRPRRTLDTSFQGPYVGVQVTI
jgi:Legionella pneumophila major outer membrane protein precursor